MFEIVYSLFYFSFSSISNVSIFQEKKKDQDKDKKKDDKDAKKDDAEKENSDKKKDGDKKAEEEKEDPAPKRRRRDKFKAENDQKDDEEEAILDLDFEYEVCALPELVSQEIGEEAVTNVPQPNYIITIFSSIFFYFRNGMP